MCPGETDDMNNAAALGFYNRALIDLAAQVGDARPLPGADHPSFAVRRASASSPICGSRVDVALTVDEKGAVTGFGYAVEACALTKAVIAVMQDAVIGAAREEISAAHAALSLLLAGGDTMAVERALPGPGWAKLMVLAPLKDYPVRHNAMQLPFEAVEKALRNKPL